MEVSLSLVRYGYSFDAGNGHNRMMSPRRILALAGILTGFWFFSMPNGAFAATLGISPAGRTINNGDTATYSVVVSSADQAVNAVSGRVQVPSDIVDLVGVSTSGSIISLWVNNPAINGNVVSFEGVVLNPGYKGGGGTIVTFTVRAKREGTGTILFRSGAVLANDGLGTNVLSGLGQAGVIVRESTQPTIPVPPPESKAVTPPGGVALRSPSHPDPVRWYRNQIVQVEWEQPQGATGVNVALDRSPDTLLATRSLGNLASRTFEDVAEGVWYAHLRVRTADGWTPTSHLKIQIDVTPPDELSVVTAAEDLSDPRVNFTISAHDALSGVDYYSVVIDGSSPILWHDQGTGEYETPPLSSGFHVMEIGAYDAANNVKTTVVTFSVAPQLESSLGIALYGLCEQFCPRAVAARVTLSIVGLFLILLLLLLLFWKDRRVRRKVRAMEHELLALERRAGRELHVLEREALTDLRRSERWFGRAWKSVVAWMPHGSADRALHHRFRDLALQVEKEIYVLEARKASHGLSPHEAHRLKDLMEVLEDAEALTRHHRRLKS